MHLYLTRIRTWIKHVSISKNSSHGTKKNRLDTNQSHGTPL